MGGVLYCWMVVLLDCCIVGWMLQVLDGFIVEWFSFK
jgi:hypothetical protein